jgi:transposase
MANRLAMDKVQAVKSLQAAGLSERQIARTLGISRKALRRQVGRIPSKATKAPTGKAPTGSPDPKDTKAPTGSDDVASPPAEASRSLCRAYQEAILAKLEQGLTAQRIFQDLRDEQGFTGKYSSVRRYVRRLSAHSELAFRRIEVDPGYEMQVDYGTGARCQDQEGKACRTHVFRLVLSHSRKGRQQLARSVWF